jgi:hypothetical protein
MTSSDADEKLHAARILGSTPDYLTYILNAGNMVLVRF